MAGFSLSVAGFPFDSPYAIPILAFLAPWRFKRSDRLHHRGVDFHRHAPLKEAN